MYIINTIPHGKCFVRYLRTRCFCIRNLTRSLRSLVRFLIRQQLVRNTVRLHFPWSILYIFKHLTNIACAYRRTPSHLMIVSLTWFIFYDYLDYTVFTEVPTSPDNRDSTVPGYFIGVCTCKETQMNWTQDFIYPRVFGVASKQDLA